eukprot:1519686-Prymnesium_polylepis.1
MSAPVWCTSKAATARHPRRRRPHHGSLTLRAHGTSQVLTALQGRGREAGTRTQMQRAVAMANVDGHAERRAADGRDEELLVHLALH